MTQHTPDPETASRREAVESSGRFQELAAGSCRALERFLMRPNGRRLAGIVLGLLLLVVVGVVGYRLGVAAGHAGLVNAVPVRGFGFRYPGVGLLAFLVPLVLVGLAVTFVVLLVHEPRQPAAPPAQRDGGDGIDRLRDLATMHERGQLTDEEFGAAKRKLLGL
jgi:hypothetical protein